LPRRSAMLRRSHLKRACSHASCWYPFVEADLAKQSTRRISLIHIRCAFGLPNAMIARKREAGVTRFIFSA
jgi:hypothetical protein